MVLIPFAKKYMLNWICISRNVNAGYLSKNPAAGYLLEKYIERIDWNWLSTNPSAIHLLKAYPEKIEWDFLCKNTSPEAIQMLELLLLLLYL